ncbi:MAG: hypothetical protein H6557_17140 [Lewinellaceae bacterium]|nr:hypothetical protein [Phaeodactylibacter sp.]MCB9038343.1 hypothetical protein [Lewinellaceae bacterium]
MKITQLKLREIKIPLRFQFSQSNNAGASHSHSAIAEVYTADGIIGYGESCPRTYVTGEDMGSVQAGFHLLSPKLKGASVASIEDIKSLLNTEGIGPSTRCALELALLDAWSKTREKPLAEILESEPPETLSYSLILPLIKPSGLEALLPRLRQFSPPAVKLKVDAKLEETIAKINLIRSFFGQEAPIRVDVNGGWTLQQAEKIIPRLIEQGIASFEQPLPAGQTEGLAVLTRSFGREARIMADESLLNLKQAKLLIEKGCVNHFNLKISKLGGIFNSLEVYQLAREHGIPCQLGAHFGETSLLTAAGILLCGMAGDMTAYEGAMGELLLEKDIVASPITMGLDGKLDSRRVLPEAGLGLIDEGALEKYAQGPAINPNQILSSLKSNIRR